MASPIDYFTPGQMPSAQPDQNIMPQIGAFMQDPRMLGALLQFGIGAMQPSWDGGAGALGRALGGAGEAVGRQQEQELKQQEAGSKQELRAAQAQSAEARANAAAERARSGFDRLGLQKEIEAGKDRRALMGGKIRLSNLYQQYVRDVVKRNDPLTLPKGQIPEPILPMNEWIRQNPMLRTLGLIPDRMSDTEAGDESIPSGATPTSGSVTDAPPDPRQRSAGQVYNTPRGPLKWTGTGWTNP